jgi:hypothetical protein
VPDSANSNIGNRETPVGSFPDPKQGDSGIRLPALLQHLERHSGGLEAGY